MVILRITVGHVARRLGGTVGMAEVSHEIPRRSFFHFYRGLRFRHAQAVLRQHIVSEINQMFVRPNIQAEVRLEGYPTPHDIERLTTLTTSGEVNHTEAYHQSA